MDQLRDVSGRRIAWREAGRSDAPVVALLHGLGGSRAAWDDQLLGLRAQYRVAAWDLPGYGASPALVGSVGFAELAAAAVAWFEELGAERVHLVGLSFGGMIAQYTAATFPERVLSLSLLSTSPKFGLDGTRPADWRAARLAPLDAGLEPKDFADQVLRGIAGPHISAAAMAAQRSAMERISGAALRTSIDCLVTHDSRSILPMISAPTQCLVGELDHETPVAYSEAIASLIPGATVTVIAAAGHLLNAEAPVAVNAALVGHFEAATSGSRRPA